MKKITSVTMEKALQGLNKGEIAHILKWAIIKADLEPEAQAELLRTIKVQRMKLEEVYDSE